MSRGVPSAANLHIPAVLRRITASRDVACFSPGTCEGVLQRDVPDVIKLQNLRWGDDLGEPV